MEGMARCLDIEMHQTVASRPAGIGPAEQSNQSILHLFRTHGIVANSERDVVLLFAETQFNNLTSHSIQLWPIKIHEGHTPSFPLAFPRKKSRANGPSTLSDYMHRAERTFSSVCAIRKVYTRCMWSWMDQHVGVPEVG